MILKIAMTAFQNSKQKHIEIAPIPLLDPAMAQPTRTRTRVPVCHNIVRSGLANIGPHGFKTRRDICGLPP